MEIAITIKNMSGKADKYKVLPTLTVKQLAQKVAEKEGNNLTSDNIHLVYAGHPLAKPEKTLEDVGI